MSVATNHQVKRGDTWEDATEWHRVVAWNKLAEICGEYLHKGSQIYVSGRLQTRSWTDKDDIKRYATEIVAQDIIFLDSKGQGQKSDRPPTPPQDDEAGSQGGPGEMGGTSDCPF